MQTLLELALQAEKDKGRHTAVSIIIDPVDGGASMVVSQRCCDCATTVYTDQHF
jgi:hypothetical protein